MLPDREHQVQELNLYLSSHFPQQWLSFERLRTKGPSAQHHFPSM